MSNFDVVVERTQTDFDRVYAQHPLMEKTLRGELRTDHYVRYLIETYHMVKHTIHMLSLGVACSSPTRPALRDWFLGQVDEERNHDLMLLKDLKHLGIDEQTVKATMPGWGAWGLITQAYYMSAFENPVGILGVASLTEGLGATVATKMADCLTEVYGIPRTATTFLRGHGGFDVKHIEDVKEAINDIAFESEVDYIVHARRMTIFTYGQMFSDALEGFPGVSAEDKEEALSN